MSRFAFTLYVGGESARSANAVSNLRRLGDERLGGEYDLTVVDVTLDGERAEVARILSTPTVIRESPGAERRVTGDLSDADQVCAALGLPDPASTTGRVSMADLARPGIRSDLPRH